MAAEQPVEQTTVVDPDQGKKVRLDHLGSKQSCNSAQVFVGNLDFGTTDEALAEIFAGHGNVAQAQVIKKYSRSNRSLGYGFVTFASEQEAEEAISKFDKKELNGRTINVEIAKPPTTKTRAPPAPKQPAEAPNGEGATENAEAAAGPAKRGRRNRRGRSKRGGARGGDRVPADGEAEGANGTTEAAIEAPAAEGEEKPSTRGGRGRGRSAPRGPPAGEPSKTLLFVANLPFSLDNDGLKAVFEGYNVVNAHVVVRRYGPVTGRSKGFGFVELANEDEQKKVLEAFNGKEIEGRPLQVKIAIDTPNAPAPNGDAAPETAPAAPAETESA